MKAKDFSIEKGEFAVVATYYSHNDSTGEDDETTIKTRERPRPKLYTDFATLALRARDYYKIGQVPATLRKVTFTRNDDGDFVKLILDVEGSPSYQINLSRVKREKFIAPGKDEPDPEHLKNLFIDAVDAVENRVTEYLNGDREQPVLPEVKIEEKGPELGFGGRVKNALRGKRKAPTGA